MNWSGQLDTGFYDMVKGKGKNLVVQFANYKIKFSSSRQIEMKGFGAS